MEHRTFQGLSATRTRGTTTPAGQTWTIAGTSWSSQFRGEERTTPIVAQTIPKYRTAPSCCRISRPFRQGQAGTRVHRQPMPRLRSESANASEADHRARWAGAVA